MLKKKRLELQFSYVSAYFFFTFCCCCLFLLLLLLFVHCLFSVIVAVSFSAVVVDVTVFKKFNVLLSKARQGVWIKLNQFPRAILSDFKCGLFSLTYLMRFHDNDLVTIRILKMQKTATTIDEPTTAP